MPGWGIQVGLGPVWAVKSLRPAGGHRGPDAAPGVEIPDHFNPFRPCGAFNIVKYAVGNLLMKNAHVAVVQDIVF